ncbi:MAG: tRNA (adenosine(37)-N6)-dimethylallyltransferase MiaA [Candidatus Marinimicrobia bacterium]|nr:tRNA (adenosine(37)-N6)-dimethylallyltransferase MiaA [Candidatus Neomarinimicrobiota bacterium]MCF7827534.1 tRNA (adenosine(37)-N6)-dimethylallyltransferase MiaA [Candidatus Neomarinimicrobiota bacterium]MCF7881604.1 tRNA (adenosine(37)-N6)-dimethylallyltransferase MiaA [Candidatus Neomarinimicrobiota bacterium]
MSNLNFVPILVGPTAVGKTSISIPLAQKFDGEIISADSRQVYRHLDIGTAKPGKEELEAVPHHLVDVIDLDETYTAGQFAEDAELLIDGIFERNHTPFVVGGAGFYIKALIEGIFDTPSRDDEIRERLQEEAEKNDEALYERLKKIDPDYAETIHPNNNKRIIRALEIYEVTGRRPSAHFNEDHGGLGHPYRFIGLKRPRKQLYERINRRVEMMIEDGLVEEVMEILEKGYTGEENALQTVGYQEIIEYLRDEISMEEAVSEIQKNSRRYAKRQMTWFRNQHEVTWFDLDEYDPQDEAVGAITDYLLKKDWHADDAD